MIGHKDVAYNWDALILVSLNQRFHSVIISINPVVVDLLRVLKVQMPDPCTQTVDDELNHKQPASRIVVPEGSDPSGLALCDRLLVLIV